MCLLQPWCVNNYGAQDDMMGGCQVTVQIFPMGQIAVGCGECFYCWEKEVFKERNLPLLL